MMMPLPPAADATLYDEEYFARHYGLLPMNRHVPERLSAAHKAAAHIADALRPTRVFEAGCAFGLLTEALWDQGITTHGRDLSSYALAQAREDIKPFLTQGSIAEPIEGNYDLVIALDVLHHMEEQDALCAIRHLAAAAPQFLFSVPSGKGDPRFYRTVRPLRWWLERLAEAGFAPVPGFDASCMGSFAFLAEHTTAPVDPRALTAFEGLLRTRWSVQQSSAALMKSREELACSHAQLAQARAASEALRAELAGLRLEAERLRQSLQARDEQAAARQNEIQLLKHHLEEQASELRRRNEIETLITHLERQSQHLEGQSRHLEEQARQLERQSHDLRHQAEALDAATRHRDLLLGSTSWRLTAPLRSLLTHLSRLRQRPPST